MSLFKLKHNQQTQTYSFTQKRGVSAANQVSSLTFSLSFEYVLFVSFRYN